MNSPALECTSTVMNTVLQGLSTVPSHPRPAALLNFARVIPTLRSSSSSHAVTPPSTVIHSLTIRSPLLHLLLDDNLWSKERFPSELISLFLPSQQLAIKYRTTVHQTLLVPSQSCVALALFTFYYDNKDVYTFHFTIKRKICSQVRQNCGIMMKL